MSGVIAIVGRPNVGKSALFNRIARRRIAIVHDQPGVTRDRVTAEVEWHGRPFTLIDTGGIGLVRREKASDVIMAAMLDQVDLALEAAAVILLVVNVQEGIVPLDEEVAVKLRGTAKPVLVVVNKVDTDRATPGVVEFSRLGFEKLFPVTAIHGSGIDDLMDEACRHLPPPEPGEVTLPLAEGEEPVVERLEPAVDEATGKRRPRKYGPVRLAIVGRPNVGKSSLINSLTGSSRVIVSPIPGTTRDAIDVPFEVDTEGVREKYVLIDTAGVRKARRIDDSIEYFSVERTKEAIARSDITILVLDAVSGILEQDKKVADVIVEERRACIVVVNKWDLVAEAVRKSREDEIEERLNKTRDRDDRRPRLTTLSEFGEWVQSKLFFLDYAPVIFTSATEGFQLDRLLEAVRYVAAQLRQTVPTGIVNRTLRDAIERRQPVSVQGHRLTFYYATQVRQNPAIFRLYVNRDELFSSQYEKYLSSSLRKAFGYEGCPLVIEAKARPKTIESVRRSKRHPFSENRNVRHGRPRDKGPGSKGMMRTVRGLRPGDARPGQRPGRPAPSRPVIDSETRPASAASAARPGSKGRVVSAVRRPLKAKPLGKPIGKPLGKPLGKPFGKSPVRGGLAEKRTGPVEKRVPMVPRRPAKGPVRRPAGAKRSPGGVKGRKR